MSLIVLSWRSTPSTPMSHSMQLGVLMNEKIRGEVRPILRLYMAGQSPSAQRALESRQRLIEAMGGKIEIEVIDILADPAEAEKAGILATPTLADDSVPPRRLIGDISNIEQVVAFFFGYREGPMQ